MTIEEFFLKNRKVAIAFSGGVDSSYLLYEAAKNGCQVKAYCIDSVFQPRFEIRDAEDMARKLSVPLTILKADVLGDSQIAENNEDRCYFCKKKLFSMIRDAAQKEGYALLLDGSNASDEASDRPGMLAAAELGVRSPLRECSLTKEEIRQRSKEAGLSTWNKPAYACLATRIPCGTEIRIEDLLRVEKGEEVLFGMGFSDFRIRLLAHLDAAKLEITEKQFALAFKKKEEVCEGLAPWFSEVLLDLRPRK